MLQIQDFEVKEVNQARWYEHYLPDEGSVCLEPCMGGFCVARYNKTKDLLEPKVCTNIAGIDVLAMIIDPNADYPEKEEAMGKALKIADDMI